MKRQIFDILVKLIDGTTINKEEEALLKVEGYFDNNQITDKAIKALEPYKVKNAIIMAAGFGSRMAPLTLTTPKPLVSVNGTRFIDTLIRELVRNDIKEIYIVRGYLKEKFDILLDKYPFIKFLDNDLYDKENNISSIMKAVDIIGNTYICEADLLITGSDVIRKYQYECNYIGSKVKETDDWCYDVDSNNRIYNYRKGGTNCVQAYGISYWDNESSKVLRRCLKEMYSIEENKKEFWEMCVFDKYKELFDIKFRPVDPASIVEIDTLKELVVKDSSYSNLLK